jgi:rubrerythrin
MEKVVRIKEVNPALANRRNFLKISGLTLAGTGLLLAGCNNDDDNNNSTPNSSQLPGVRNGKFDLGGGDFGVLTYAYALEQLESDFYTKVVNNYGSFSDEAKAILQDIWKHEVVHREFFRTALTVNLPDHTTQLLPDLTFDYGTLNFTNQDAVLATAMALEDTGVSAYNGAGKIFTNATFLGLAGKIVSVEARHASAIRNLIQPGTAYFAGNDQVDATTGLDKANDPSVVIGAVGDLGFITTPFTAQYLP